MNPCEPYRSRCGSLWKLQNPLDALKALLTPDICEHLYATQFIVIIAYLNHEALWCLADSWIHVMLLQSTYKSLCKFEISHEVIPGSQLSRANCGWVSVHSAVFWCRRTRCEPALALWGQRDLFVGVQIPQDVSLISAPVCCAQASSGPTSAPGATWADSGSSFFRRVGPKHLDHLTLNWLFSWVLPLSVQTPNVNTCLPWRLQII